MGSGFWLPASVALGEGVENMWVALCGGDAKNIQEIACLGVLQMLNDNAWSGNEQFVYIQC